MFHVDILSGYAICAVGSLVGAAMLRMAEGDDPLMRSGLRQYGWGLLVLGVAVLPTTLGAPRVGHPLAQLWIAAGTLVSVIMIAKAVAQFCGRRLPRTVSCVSAFALAAACAVAQREGPVALGKTFAVGLALSGTVCAWATWRFTLRARDFTERAIGVAMASLALSGWVRVFITLPYEGPPRIDLMYLPQDLVVVYALLYGVLPLIVTALVLNLVNSRLRQQLHHRAGTDELTGAASRRALREAAPTLMAQAQARRRRVAVLMLDLDHFKLINDRFGHAIGDAVLQQATRLLQGQLRQDCLLARYGGEEFVVVLPVDAPAEAAHAAERLRRAVERHPWATLADDKPGEAPLRVTTSIGIALVGPEEELDAALGRADLALYRAKRGGRNRCEVGPGEQPAPPATQEAVNPTA